MERFKDFKVFLTELKDGVLTATINRPEARNAMNSIAWKELSLIADIADESSDIKIVILTGAGDKAFVAGADINELKVRTGVDNIAGSASMKALNKIEASSKMFIAAINGFAFGGGFEIAMACDIRICSDNAQFALPETGIGIIPGAGGTQRLPRLIGIGRAKEIVLAGRKLSATEAVNMGVAMKAVPQADLLAEANAIAGAMLTKSLVALALAKKSLNASMYTDLTTGIMLEGLAFSVALSSEDKVEGTTSFFEKRPPVFPGK